MLSESPIPAFIGMASDTAHRSLPAPLGSRENVTEHFYGDPRELQRIEVRMLARGSERSMRDDPLAGGAMATLDTLRLHQRGIPLLRQ
jgi:hypothetical protein